MVIDIARHFEKETPVMFTDKHVLYNFPTKSEEMQKFVLFQTMFRSN